MFRPVLIVLAVVLGACGPLGPPKTDGGTGGGGSLFTGGGVGGGSTGGGSSGGGGGASGGGTGGGTTGGGTGGGATGGAGGGGTGGGGGLAPLTWASISMSGATSSSYIIGLSGSATDLWAAQDTGYLFHSTGGAFSLAFPIQYGVKALYANGGTVVIVQTRNVRTCTSNCTSLASYADLQLLNSPLSYNLFGEAVCGRGPNEITVIVTDTQNMGQRFDWDGTTWTRTDTNLGIAYPRACWFDSSGALYVVGQDAVIRSESGATTTDTLSSNLTGYYGGGEIGGTQWVVGPNHYISRRTAPGVWSKFPVTTSSTLWTVGGLSEAEVYAFGYWETTNGNGFKWNGTTLTGVGNLLPATGTQSSIRAMLVTAPNELYVGGNNQSGPIIIRGRR